MVRPHAFRTRSITSGFSGSPALTTSRKDVFQRASSSPISIRQTVGGAQSVVTPQRTMVSSMRGASKRA